MAPAFSFLIRGTGLQCICGKGSGVTAARGQGRHAGPPQFAGKTNFPLPGQQPLSFLVLLGQIPTPAQPGSPGGAVESRGVSGAAQLSLVGSPGSDWKPAVPTTACVPDHRLDPPCMGAGWGRGPAYVAHAGLAAGKPARWLRWLPPAQVCSSLPGAPSLPEKCHRPPGNGRQA